MKPRIAIYGRHSTDKQNPESTNDQAETCRRVVDYLGGEVVDLYLDPDVSGYRRDRLGLRRLLADVRDGRIDIVVCEAMDRIARDAEDIAWLGKKLKFSRVRMHTVAENEIDDIKLAVASMLGSIFLSQLQQKTLRGMQAAVLAGRFAGGRAYGYRKVNRVDERGEPVRGLLEIAGDEAEIVRRTYREFAAGRSARDIAKRLNADGIVSPRGGQWNQSTVRGDPKKLVGILNNPLYVGQLVWGRREWRKNPDSERRERRYRLRDKSEWVEIAVPDLRIVDDGLAISVLEEREAEAEGLRLRLLAGDASSVNVIAHPAMRARFEQRVADLRESLSDPENRGEVAEVLADLIEEIVIHPGGADALTDVEIAADLSKMVGFANAESRPPRRGRLSESTIKVVAGTGFEPVTFRL